jgi:hypothetical protein
MSPSADRRVIGSFPADHDAAGGTGLTVSRQVVGILMNSRCGCLLGDRDGVSDEIPPGVARQVYWGLHRGGEPPGPRTIRRGSLWTWLATGKLCRFHSRIHGLVRAENVVHGPDQQGCLPAVLRVMITDHVPAVRLPPDHESRRVATAVAA